MRDLDTAFDLSDVISCVDLASLRAMTVPTLVVDTTELDTVLTALADEVASTTSA